MTLPLMIADQSLRNREFVRRLLKQKQPLFAAALDLGVAVAEQELTESARRGKVVYGWRAKDRDGGRVRRGLTTCQAVQRWVRPPACPAR
jgi:hypothetical protein